MGAITSQIGQQNLKVNSSQVFQQTSDLERQKTHPKILVSINKDNTVKVSVGKSIATQTPREEYSNETEEKNGVKDMDNHESKTSAMKEKQDLSVQTDIIIGESCLIPSKSMEDKQGRANLSEAEQSSFSKINTNESENEAGETTDYWTDMGVQTDDDFDHEHLGPKIAWGSKSVDSADSLDENIKEVNVKEVKVKEEKEIDSQAESDTPTPARSFEQMSLERYGKYKVRLSSDKERCIISSSSFLDTGDAVFIDRSNQRIKFVDKKFQFISSYDLSSKPWAICARGIDVYVTLGNTKIQHLTVEDMIIESIEVFEIKGRCLGICVFGEFLAVGLQIGEICLLDFKGKKQGTIKLPTFNGKSCNPWHLTVTTENNMLVTDSDAGALYCINKKSELVFTFKGIGLPRGTAIDSEGNILIVGRDKETGTVVTIIHKDEELSHMLHIEQQSEIRSRILMTWDELEFVPYCICSRSDRVVVLGGIQESLKITKLK